MRTIIQFIDSIVCPDLRAVCREIPRDPAFATTPASLSFHHAYRGGLKTHTREVCEIACYMAAGMPGCDRDVLLAAALWHDVAKILEYEAKDQPMHWGAPDDSLFEAHYGDPANPEAFSRYWIRTAYQKTVGHISGSAGMFWHAARQQGGVKHDTAVAIQHAILAHHGPVKAWGSPVEPQTLEALILHQADMLSAKYGATKDTPL